MNKFKYDEIKKLFPIINENLKKGVLKKAEYKIHSGYLLGHSRNKIDDFYIESSSDWDKTLLMPESEQWHFHTLQRGFGVLLNKKIVSDENLAYVKKHVQIWENWNQTAQTSNTQVWSGHTVALRLNFLACCYISFKENHWLVNALKEHMEYLSKEENYDGNWNHGLDQNIALITASYLLNDKDFIDIAYKRVIENFNIAFDDDGVNNEQSITYHHYNIERFSHLKSILKKFGLDVNFIDERLEKAKEFLLHSLLPNGYYTPLGDSLYQKPMFELLSDDLIYFNENLSLPKNIDKPLSKIYNAGYVYGRSSWDASANPSHYSIRFGPARIIHGHNDHMSMTFYANEKMVLNDGGFNGYQADYFRHYFRSPQSHNVVSAIDESVKFNWDATTCLKESKKLSDGSQIFVLEDTPYEHTTRNRKIYMDISNNFFICYDSINSLKDRVYSQNWHLYPGFAVSYVKNGMFKLTDELSQYFIYNSYLMKDFELLKGYTKINNGQISAVSGYFGAGHNTTQETYTLKTIGSGKKVSFTTVFSETKLNVLSDTNEQLILEVNSGLIYVINKYEFNIDKYNKSIDIELSPTSFEKQLYLEMKGNNFYFYNKTQTRVKVTTNLIKKNNDSVLIFIKENKKNNNSNTYFYLSSLKGKLRFNEYYIISGSNFCDENISYWVEPNSFLECNVSCIKLKNIGGLDNVEQS